MEAGLRRERSPRPTRLIRRPRGGRARSSALILIALARSRASCAPRPPSGYFAETERRSSGYFAEAERRSRSYYSHGIDNNLKVPLVVDLGESEEDRSASEAGQTLPDGLSREPPWITLEGPKRSREDVLRVQAPGWCPPSQDIDAELLVRRALMRKVVANGDGRTRAIPQDEPEPQALSFREPDLLEQEVGPGTSLTGRDGEVAPRRADNTKAVGLTTPVVNEPGS